MNKHLRTEEFYQELFNQQKQRDAVPSNKELTLWAEKLICVMYPQFSTCALASVDAVRKAFSHLETDLLNILNTTTACIHCNNHDIAMKFFEQMPEVYRKLNTDVEAIVAGDPAAHTTFEVVRAYPGFYALSFYRIAHELFKLDVPFLPRILTEHAHSQTGIDIHPAAVIGDYFCIDHGTGIVIGETTIIGNNVKIYQGVTLGALSVNKDQAKSKRHPTIEDNVVIYSGATILGGDTVIGHDSVIGGNVWLTNSVLPDSIVYHKSEITIRDKNPLPDVLNFVI